MNNEKKNAKFRLPRKLLAALAAGVLVVSVAVGGTLAYFKDQANNVVNSFQSGTIQASVVESINNNSKTLIAVKNDGSAGAYARVRLVAYWVDDEGKILAKPSPSTVFTPNTGWVYRQADGYYYCTSVIFNGSQTPNLLPNGTSLSLAAEDDAWPVIEVFAETVQATPSNAANDLWGIHPSDLP